MIRTLLLLFIILFIFIPRASSQEISYRDPFASLFPKKVDSSMEIPDEALSANQIYIPESLGIVVEGIILGGEMSQAIINGEVYREGDILKAKGAKILKIDEGTVSILYDGIIYEMMVEKIRTGKSKKR